MGRKFAMRSVVYHTVGVARGPQFATFYTIPSDVAYGSQFAMFSVIDHAVWYRWRVAIRIALVKTVPWKGDGSSAFITLGGLLKIPLAWILTRVQVIVVPVVVPGHPSVTRANTHI